MDDLDLLQWLNKQKADFLEDSRHYDNRADFMNKKACDYAVVAYQRVIDFVTGNLKEPAAPKGKK